MVQNKFKGDLMYKVWGRLRKDNKNIRDMVAECDLDNHTKKDCLTSCIEQICNEFDLQRPMLLPKNQRELEKLGLTSFNQDNFIETIYFDTLEIEIIEDE